MPREIIYLKSDVVELFEKTIGGQEFGVDLDDLMMAARRGDDFTMTWARKIAKRRIIDSFDTTDWIIRFREHGIS
ncbi:MAG: hypothetical protein HKP25_12370 [Marinicaulis sp.]|nr:hypothetical protein [Marinicaulis sp.]